MGHSTNSMIIRAGKSLLWKNLIISSNFYYFFGDFATSFLICIKYIHYIFLYRFFHFFYRNGFIFSYAIIKKNSLNSFNITLFLYDKMYLKMFKGFFRILFKVRRYKYVKRMGYEKRIEMYRRATRARKKMFFSKFFKKVLNFFKYFFKKSLRFKGKTKFSYYFFETFFKLPLNLHRFPIRTWKRLEKKTSRWNLKHLYYKGLSKKLLANFLDYKYNIPKSRPYYMNIVGAKKLSDLSRKSAKAYARGYNGRRVMYKEADIRRLMERYYSEYIIDRTWKLITLGNYYYKAVKIALSLPIPKRLQVKFKLEKRKKQLKLLQLIRIVRNSKIMKSKFAGIEFKKKFKKFLKKPVVKKNKVKILSKKSYRDIMRRRSKYIRIMRKYKKRMLFGYLNYNFNKKYKIYYNKYIGILPKYYKRLFYLNRFHSKVRYNKYLKYKLLGANWFFKPFDLVKFLEKLEKKKPFLSKERLQLKQLIRRIELDRKSITKNGRKIVKKGLLKNLNGRVKGKRSIKRIKLRKVKNLSKKLIINPIIKSSSQYFKVLKYLKRVIRPKKAIRIRKKKFFIKKVRRKELKKLKLTWIFLSWKQRLRDRKYDYKLQNRMMLRQYFESRVGKRKGKKYPERKYVLKDNFLQVSKLKLYKIYICYFFKKTFGTISLNKKFLFFCISLYLMYRKNYKKRRSLYFKRFLRLKKLKKRDSIFLIYIYIYKKLNNFIRCYKKAKIYFKFFSNKYKEVKKRLGVTDNLIHREFVGAFKNEPLNGFRFLDNRERDRKKVKTLEAFYNRMVKRYRIKGNMNKVKKLKTAFGNILSILYKFFQLWFIRRITMVLLKILYKNVISNLVKFVKKKLEYLVKKKLNLNIYPLHLKTLRTEILSAYIRWKMGRNFPLRGIIRPFLRKVKKRSYLSGLYVKGQGRFTRKQRAAIIKQIKGKVPFSKVKAFLAYSFLTVITKYGTCGIRIWLNYNRKKIRFRQKLLVKLC